MQYDPIKKSIGRFFSGPLIMRKILYALLDLLLLRTWHVKKALKMLSPQLPYYASVLDAGSGFGQYTWRMSKMRAGWKISAIDIDSEHIEDCARFFDKAGLSGRVVFSTGDLTVYSDPDAFNLIVSVDVMEHIENDSKVFRNFFNSLKNDGILLISTPSDKGGSDVHDEEAESFINEHVRDGYSINEITNKLSEAGFKSIQVSYAYGIPGNISWRLSMKYPIKMLNLSKLFFIILPFYYLVISPVAFILNFSDLIINHKSGSGLIVIARK